MRQKNPLRRQQEASESTSMRERCARRDFDDDVQSLTMMMRETLVCIRKTAARHKRGE